MFIATTSICVWDFYLENVFKAILSHHKKVLLWVENLGFLSIYWRQRFTFFPSPRKQKETGAFPNQGSFRSPKDSPDQQEQAQGSPLQGCKNIAVTVQTTGKSPKMWKNTDIKESHWTLKSLAWGNNKMFPRTAETFSIVWLSILLRA